MRGDQFQCDEYRWVGSQPKDGRIFPFKVQFHSLPQIPGHLVEGRPLGDHGHLQTLGHITGLLSGSNDCLNCALKHDRPPSVSVCNWVAWKPIAAF